MNALVPGTGALERLSRSLDSGLLCFLFWLSINPVVTALTPEPPPFLQALMLGHRNLGLGFLAFLLVYFPLHLFANYGFSAEVTRKLLSGLRGAFFILVSYRIISWGWEWSRWTSLVSLPAAFVLFEVSQKGRPLWRRGLDCLVVAVLTFGTFHATRDELIRFLVFVMAGYGLSRLAASVRPLFTATETGDLTGWMVAGAAVPMVLFAVMMFGGTNAGRYTQILPAMDPLHYLFSLAFVALVFVHFWTAVRKRRREGRTVRVLSLPVVAATLPLFLAWDAAHVYWYQRYAPPGVDAGQVRLFRPSRYSNLQGYRLPDEEEDWFVGAAQQCATVRCHTEVVAQHQLSAHGRAMENEAFKRELATFIGEKGRAAADYCLACHAPLGVIRWPGDGSRGRVVNPIATRDPAFTLGVACVVCHRASPDRERERLGNASLTIRPTPLNPVRFLGEGRGNEPALHVWMIQGTNPLHRATYHVDPKEFDFVCAACHVVKLPASLSANGREMPVADHYLSFVDSPFGKAGLTCATCHQPRFATFEISYDTVSHHYLGSGSSLPYRDRDDSLLRRVSQGFLAGLGDVTLVVREPSAELPPCLDDIPAHEGRRPMLRQRDPLKLEDEDRVSTRPAERQLLKTGIRVSAAGEDFIEVAVETTNSCIAHTFPAGGGMKGALEVRALDARGATLASYGGLDAEGLPLDLPTNLGSQAADAYGEVIHDRRFWNTHTLLKRRVIKPGETIEDHVRLSMPRDARAAAVEARWFYVRPEVLRNHEWGIRAKLDPIVIGHSQVKVDGG